MALRGHYLLAALSLLAVTLLVVTMRRVPTPFADSLLYASIARSEQLHGVGIPSVLRHSPLAVDHVPFYGPVYFTLVARAFDWFGVSLRAQRLVSLSGALLMAAAAALLAQAVTQTKWRWLWAVTLLLLTPEIRAYATLGTMATLAIGCEMMALAVFVCGSRASRHAPLYGIASGLLLGAAALTTPRTYLFVAAFFAAHAVRPRRHLFYTFGTFASVVCTWAIASHSSVTRWAKYVGFILLHEDTDVAFLPSAQRQWFFSAGYAVIPFIAAACALGAASYLSRRGADARDEEQHAIASPLLLTGWITFIAGLVTLNLTFTQTTYIALPLFICVLAMPYESLRLPKHALTAAVVAIVGVEACLGTVWYARVAATWEARNPEALYRFVDAHVPDGAAVVGPHAPYFFAVERSGARYRSAWPESWADWARWVPVVEPEAVDSARQAPKTETRGRFLIWQAGDDLPDAFACAAHSPIAVYQAPPNDLELLGWIGERTWDTGYPASVLYRLPPGCPAGYDPTKS